MTKIHCLPVAILIALSLMIGCETKPAAKDDPTSHSGEHTHDDGTVHKDGDGHDLGAADEADHSAAGHSHGAGPHGGSVVDWGGGKFHVELTVDHDQQQATVYILGDDEKTPTAIDAQEVTLAIKDPMFDVTLMPSPQDGDAAGKASRFVGTHQTLSTVKEFQGSISALVDGTPYSGDFDEAAGDH